MLYECHFCIYKIGFYFLTTDRNTILGILLWKKWVFTIRTYFLMVNHIRFNLYLLEVNHVSFNFFFRLMLVSVRSLILFNYFHTSLHLSLQHLISSFEKWNVKTNIHENLKRQSCFWNTYSYTIRAKTENSMLWPYITPAVIYHYSNSLSSEKSFLKKLKKWKN